MSILDREVYKGLIILHTPQNYEVFELRDWNLNRQNAHKLFECATKKEVAAYKKWAINICKGGNINDPAIA